MFWSELCGLEIGGWTSLDIVESVKVKIMFWSELCGVRDRWLD